MSISTKYGRTYHYPFSPGTTSDDRINHDYWQNIQHISQLVHTEKLDGENNCLSRYGVFARSHAAPTTSPWSQAIRMRWESIKNDLGDLELFGENLYAVHSIEYRKLEQHYFVFAARYGNTWLCWEEVQFFAAAFDMPIVPVIQVVQPGSYTEQNFRNEILQIVMQPGALQPYDVHSRAACTMEGIVSRNTGEYIVDDVAHNVFKYVRKGHVKTDEHWTRNWKRAKLQWEYPAQ